MSNAPIIPEPTQQTRQAILEAARRRFLHYGFKKTTIDEIAAEAGVGKGTVYLYFSNKEEILLTIAREVKRNITEQMRAIAGSLGAPEAKLRQMLMASILSTHDAARATTHGVELVDELLRPQLKGCAEPERNAQITLLAQVIDEGVRSGIFALPAIDSRQAATHLTLALVPFFPPYLNPCHATSSCRVDLEERAGAMLDFLLCAIRRGKP